MKRTRIKPVSAGTKARKQERRDAVNAAAERDGHRCRVLDHWPHHCIAPLDGHEVLTRGRGGSPYDPDNIVMACRVGHDYLHAHPVWAAGVGLLAHSWESA